MSTRSNILIDRLQRAGKEIMKIDRDAITRGLKDETVAGRLADDLCEMAAIIRDDIDQAFGTTRRPGTLLRQIRRVLGYTYP